MSKKMQNDMERYFSNPILGVSLGLNGTMKRGRSSPRMWANFGNQAIRNTSRTKSGKRKDLKANFFFEF